MDSRELLGRYTDLLLDRIEESKYPSKGLMNRVEATPLSEEQSQRYVEILIGKVQGRYPSLELLDRLHRVLMHMVIMTTRSDAAAA